MLNKMALIAEETLKQRKMDVDEEQRIALAKKGQSPKYLLISPIQHSAQDLELFDFKHGDAFHAVRVKGHPLLPPDDSPALFAGPAAYNSHFSDQRGVIITFDADEPDSIIRESLQNLVKHPDVVGLPIVAARVNYESGEVTIIPHEFQRDPELEQEMTMVKRKPSPLDSNTLVFICSDSRVHPPRTQLGLPMAVQVLGGYIPPYTGKDDETSQLDRFFEQWLTSDPKSKKALIVMHGSFSDEHGSVCGAANASLNPHDVDGKYLRTMIAAIANDSGKFEKQPPRDADERVLGLAKAIEHNLFTYPSVARFRDDGRLTKDFVNTILMETVTNLLRFPDELSKTSLE